MFWKILKNNPKRESDELYSRSLRFAKFSGKKIVAMGVGVYDFSKGEYLNNFDGYTHWLYEDEVNIREMLENLPREQ